MVQYDGTLLYEATLYGLNSGDFILNWTTVSATSYEFNFLALTGVPAKVVHWTSNTSTGNQSITGAGFQPDCVIHIGDADAGHTANTTTSSVYSIGAMDASGNQWSKYGFAMSGVTTTSTGRIQLADSCIVDTGATTSVHTKASFVSMDADGFTIHWGTYSSGGARDYLSLCLNTGGGSLVGNWTKSTAAAPTTDTISVLTITPTAVLATTDSYPANTSEQSGHRIMVGASDGTNNLVAGATDKNGIVLSGSSKTVTYRYLNESYSLAGTNNDLGSYDSLGTIGSFAAGSFQASWPTTNANIATQICFVTFGNPRIVISRSIDVVPVLYPSTYISGFPSVIPASVSIAPEVDLSVTTQLSSVITRAITHATHVVPTVSKSIIYNVISRSVTITPHAHATTTQYPTTGIGMMTFGGVDITQPPYYAHLADATKYWWLDGFDSTQFTTSPLSTISTRPYLKDWVISTVIRPKVPDNKRTTMIAAMIALGEVFDPTKGEQQLTFGEYPASYFIAKRQKSNPSNENVTPTLLDLDIDFACTGPAYSVVESVIWATASGVETSYATFTSKGDTLASPRWRFYSAGYFNGTLTITNVTTDEAISWTGTLNVADTLEFIMDAEYGTPYTVFLNNEQSLSSFNGPAWPHLQPGLNEIELSASTPIHGILEARWRDRFLVGQQVAPTPSAASAVIPTILVLNGKDSTSPGSYVFSGTLKDVFGNPVVGATVTLASSTDTAHWNNLQTTTTNASGSYTFAATAVYTGLQEFRTMYIGGSGYLGSTSEMLHTYPPDQRIPVKLSLSMDASASPYYTFSGSLVLASNTKVPIPNAPIHLEVKVPASLYTSVPFTFDGQTNFTLANTDIHGKYSYTYYVGPTTNGISGSYTWNQYFTTQFAANLYYRAASPPSAMTVSNQNTPWPAQNPGPVTYMISVNPEMIDAGMLQYFAGCGFTVCFLICNNPDMYTNTLYQKEYDMITSVGMVPMLDVEKVDQYGTGTPSAPGPNSGSWSNCQTMTQVGYFGTWFANLAAVGWQGVSSEMGAAGAVEFCRKYFPNYTNYTPPEPFSWYAPGQYYEQAVDTSTTQNSIEAYYNSDPPYIYTAALQSAELGIPMGILGYVGGSTWNSIYVQSLNDETPSYQSLFDWSYANGVGFNTFQVWIDPGSWNILLYGEPHQYFLNGYRAAGYDTIVAQLQESYPPAGTEVLNITQLATELTLYINENSDGTYTISGQLYEVLSGNPIPSAQIFLQLSTNTTTNGLLSTHWNNTNLGNANPTTTDQSGSWTSTPITLTSGTYYFRAYYTGTSTYLGSYSGDYYFGLGVTKGGPPSSLTITADDTTPAINQVVNFTVTLTGGGNPIVGDTVTIYHYIGTGGTKYTDGSGVTDANGDFTIPASFTTAGLRTYYATFSGDDNFAGTTSAVLDITVTGA
jgi:hypothetical protein